MPILAIIAKPKSNNVTNFETDDENDEYMGNEYSTLDYNLVDNFNYEYYWLCLWLFSILCILLGVIYCVVKRSAGYKKDIDLNPKVSSEVVTHQPQYQLEFPLQLHQQSEPMCVPAMVRESCTPVMVSEVTDIRQFERLRFLTADDDPSRRKTRAKTRSQLKVAEEQSMTTSSSSERVPFELPKPALTLEQELSIRQLRERPGLSGSGTPTSQGYSQLPSSPQKSPSGTSAASSQSRGSCLPLVERSQSHLLSPSPDISVTSGKVSYISSTNISATATSYKGELKGDIKAEPFEVTQSDMTSLPEMIINVTEATSSESSEHSAIIHGIPVTCDSTGFESDFPSGSTSNKSQMISMMGSSDETSAQLSDFPHDSGIVSQQPLLTAIDEPLPESPCLRSIASTASGTASYPRSSTVESFIKSDSISSPESVSGYEFSARGSDSDVSSMSALLSPSANVPPRVLGPPLLPVKRGKIIQTIINPSTDVPMDLGDVSGSSGTQLPSTDEDEVEMAIDQDIEEMQSSSSVAPLAPNEEDEDSSSSSDAQQKKKYRKLK